MDNKILNKEEEKDKAENQIKDNNEKEFSLLLESKEEEALKCLEDDIQLQEQYKKVIKKEDNEEGENKVKINNTTLSNEKLRCVTRIMQIINNFSHLFFDKYYFKIRKKLNVKIENYVKDKFLNYFIINESFQENIIWKEFYKSIEERIELDFEKTCALPKEPKDLFDQLIGLDLKDIKVELIKTKYINDKVCLLNISFISSLENKSANILQENKNSFGLELNNIKNFSINKVEIINDNTLEQLSHNYFSLFKSKKFKFAMAYINMFSKFTCFEYKIGGLMSDIKKNLNVN